MTTNLRTLQRPNIEIFATKEREGDSDNPVPHTKDNSRIVAILPRGEAIRNFVYTGALDEIARSAEVSVLTVIPNREVQSLLLSRYHNLYALQGKKEPWVVNVLREILDMAHGRWLWSEAAQERWRLRDVEATSAYQRGKRLIKKMLCSPFANRRGLELLGKAECALSRRLQTTDEYLRLFKERKPDLVFNGSHVHSQIATQAVHAAQTLGIKTAAFIFSWDNLTSQGRIIPPYDYYLVWNEAIRDQLLQIYGAVRPEQVFVVGTPQFDFHFNPEYYWSREKFCDWAGADPARPIVLYSTGMANHMPGEPLIVEAVADMLKEMTDLGSPQLLVRVYPKDRSGRFEALKQKRPDILFPSVPWEPAWLTPKPEDAYVLTNTLRHVAAGVNVASTISLELCMFDKPVVNVGYNPPGVDKRDVDYARYYEFDHYRPVVESGAVRVARSESEMRTLLRRALTDASLDGQQRRDLIRRMFDKSLDGYSGARAANQLIQLAGAGSPRYA
jgi:hypothetical protein